MRQILLDYPAGRLEPETQAALEKHLDGCPACRDAVEAQTAVWNALDAWEPAPVSMDFNRRLWQKIDERAALPWYTALLNWKPMLPAAAVALLVLAGGLVFERPHERTIQSVAAADGVSVTEPGSVSVTEVDQAVSTLDDLQLLQELDSARLPDSDAAGRI
jgi:anti-sigma factor RsiW